MALLAENDTVGKTVKYISPFQIPPALFSAIPASQNPPDEDQPFSSATDENNPLMDIARWLYYIPVKMEELQKLRGPLRDEFEDCVFRKPCSVEILTMLKTIHDRMMK